MPQNLTDVDEFTDPIEAPLDGDAAAAAIFIDTPQGLTNRTRYLFKRQTPALTTVLGTTRADAAPMVDCNTIIQAGGANRGLIFTTAQRGLSGRIWNGTGYPVKLYPIIGETLLELKNPGVTTPYPVAANDSPITIPAYSVVDWTSNLVGPGGGGGIPGTPAWKWFAKVQDDIARTLPGLEGYASGSWTPGVVGAAGAPTYTLRYGRFTRIGSMVTVVGRVAGDFDTLTGQLGITGLPYVADCGAGSEICVGSFLGSGLRTPYGNPVMLTIIDNSTTLGMYAPDSGGGSGFDGTIGGGFTSSAAFDISFAFSYPTDASF